VRCLHPRHGPVAMSVTSIFRRVRFSTATSGRDLNACRGYAFVPLELRFICGVLRAGMLLALESTNFEMLDAENSVDGRCYRDRFHFPGRSVRRRRIGASCKAFGAQGEAQSGLSMKTSDVRIRRHIDVRQATACNAGLALDFWCGRLLPRSPCFSNSLGRVRKPPTCFKAKSLKNVDGI
jgi:hypothetical protein